MISDDATSTRAALRDRELQRRYDQEGYAILPLLEQPEVDALVEVARSAYGGAMGFISSSTDPDREKRRRLAEIVIDACAPAVARAMVDMRVIMGGFLIKPANDPEVYFEPHVDWSLVDEHKDMSFQVWMPLADTDVESGGLFILPRSCKLIDTPRGSPIRFAHALDRLAPQQIMKYGRFMSMRGGEALLMDPGTVHWSPPNQTPDPRICIVLGIVPEDVELRHYYARPDGSFHAYGVDDEFFRSFDAGDVPDGTYLGPVEVAPHRVDEQTVWRVCAPDMSAGPRPLPAADGTHPSRLSFRQRDKQRALDDEGFATLHLLNETELGALKGVTDEARSRASGFYDSALDDDVEFRDHVSDLVSRICAPHVDKLFSDAEVLTGRIIVEASGDSQSSRPPQDDPTIVDESRVTSCEIWMPLTDTSTMQLLPRSHRLVDSPRGPGLKSQFYSLSLDEVEQFGQPVTLRAGQAVARDHRVLHWSSANATSQAVVAIGLTIVPRGAPLQRFAVGSDMRVHQYRVERRFFAEHEISDQPEGEDLGPIVFDPHAITTEDLIALFPPPPVNPVRRFLRTALLRVPPGMAARVPAPLKRLVRGLAQRLT